MTECYMHWCTPSSCLSLGERCTVWLYEHYLQSQVDNRDHV